MHGQNRVAQWRYRFSDVHAFTKQRHRLVKNTQWTHNLMEKRSHGLSSLNVSADYFW